MASETSKKRSKKNFYLYVISEILRKGCLPTIGSKQKLNYYVKSLKTNKLIEKKGYGVWQLTPLGHQCLDKKQVKKFNLGTLIQPTPFKKNKDDKTWIRTHGLQWSVKLPISYSRIGLFKIFKAKGLDPEITGNKTIKIYLLGHNLHFGRNSITIYFDKSVYFKSNTANEGFKAAVYELERLIKRVESITSTSAKIRKIYRFKCCKKHFGDVGNAIATYFAKKSQPIRVFDQGKEWLIMDFSDKTFIETETTDNDRNIVDMDSIVTPFMNKLRHEPKVLDRIDNDADKMVRVMAKMQQQLTFLMEREQKSNNIKRFT